MSDEEIKQTVVGWFQKNAKPGTKTKFYMKDVVKGLPDCDKRAVQKALNDCTVDGTLMYWSTGSSTMFCLAEHFNE
jgi:hypothetical protein